MIQGGGSARVSQFPPVTPLAGLRERFGDGVPRRARARLLELQADAGARHDACSTDRCRSRTTRAANAAASPVLVEPGDRGWFTFTGPFTPEVPAEFSMRISGTVVAPESGVVDVQAGADRPGPADDRRRRRRRQLEAHRPQRRVHGIRELRGDRGRSTSSRASGTSSRWSYVLAGPSMGALAIGCTPPAPPDLLDRAVALARARRRGRVRGRHRRRLGDARATTASRWRCPPRRTSSCAAVAAVNSAHDRRRERGVTGRHGLGRRRRRDPAVLVRGGGVGPHARRRALRRHHRRRASCRRRSRFVSRTRPRSRTTRASAARCTTAKACSSATAGTTRGASSRGSASATVSRTRRSRSTAPRCRPPRSRVAACTPASDGSRRRSRAQHRRAAGAEVVQCYVHDAEASVARPPQRAQGVRQGMARPGRAGEATLELDRRSFAFWDVEHDDWIVEPGEFELRIGTSSRSTSRTGSRCGSSRDAGDSPTRSARHGLRTNCSSISVTVVPRWIVIQNGCVERLA